MTTAERLIALDTSAAVPFLMASHTAHEAARSQLRGRPLALTQHSSVETYSVLTRLPGDARVAPADAVRLIGENFGEPLLLDEADAVSIPSVLSAIGVAGGAVYDAVVGLAARANGVPLATRDARATATYQAVGVEFEVISDST